MKKSTSSASSNSTFGAAKPLPGQAGYKVSETTILERDAKEMEARLKMLQERMRLQQQEAEANAKLAGAGSNSRWKSSKAEKGSIRSYGKDVQEKQKKRAEGGGGDSSMRSNMLTSSSIDVSSSLRKQTEYPSAGTYLSKEIDRWTPNDVGDWLVSVNLHQYIDAFILNEINGIILLDITLEDLDYMGITALGHRKTILKGAEDLRVHRRVVNPPQPPPGAELQQSPNRQKYSSMENSAKEEAESSMGAHGSPRAPKAEPVKATHWSMLEPLSKMEVQDPGSQSSSINAADADIYDEEAERRAFQEAVSAWRKGGQTETQKSKAAVPAGNVTIERDYEAKKDDGMWQNPFAAPAPVPASSRSKELQSSTSASNQSLKQGNLDEELEHAEFVRAVDAWRTAGKDKPPSAPTSSSSSVGTAGGNGLRSTSYLVEKLEKQLEQEQEELSRRLQKQKEEATMKLKQCNLDYAKLKQSSFSVSKSSARGEAEEEKSRTPTAARVFDDEVTEDEKENDEADYYRQKSEEKYGDIRTYTFSKSPSDYHNRYNREDVLGASTDEDNDNDDDGGHTSPLSPHQSSSVAISLVESVMYGGPAEGSAAAAGEEESYYIVEYDSDNQGA